MEKVCIVSENGPPAMGPYSAAVVAGQWLYVSGQCSIDPKGSGPMPGTLAAETRQALDNLTAVLVDAGSDLAHVVKTTVYLASMEDFAEFNAIYETYFPEAPPARTCIQAGRLPADLKVEIDAVALLAS